MNKLLMASCLCCLISSPAIANPFSISAGIGKTNADFSRDSNDITQVDYKDTSFDVELAYHYRQFALNLGYTDLGNGSTLFETDTFDIGQYHDSVDEEAPILASGLTAGIEMNFIEDKAFFFDVQMGLFAWRNTIVSTTSKGNILRSKENSTDAYWGMETGGFISEELSLSIQYRQFMLKERVDNFTVKLAYHF